MKYESLSLIALIGLTSAAPMPAAENTIPRYILRAREVPQEHSHNRFIAGTNANLDLNNPAGIVDAVFGLLGNAAAASGAGTITDLDCLHQATADQAFTNAKAAGNVTGQSDALLYAALERNTGSVGLASVSCTETAVNPEIQAVQQHQDPASAGAAATNKAIVLALAQQLSSIGANPQDALLSGTFAPGSVTDTTGAGNTCDTADDVEGCIFSQNLLVNDATAAEIDAAVAGGSTAVASNSTAVSGSAASSSSATKATKAAKGAAKATSSASAVAAAATPASSAASTGSKESQHHYLLAITNNVLANVQTFTGTLGGAPPPVVSSAGTRPFSVNGDTFVNAGAALQRSCSVQNNACADAVNSGGSGSVSDCNTQETACNAAAAAKKVKSRAALDFFVASHRRATALKASASNSTASTTTSTGTIINSFLANVQTFTGTLGGAAPAVVQGTGARPFTVNGDTFVNQAAALQRSCSVQNTACSNAANSGSLAGTTVGDCNTQEAACNAAAA
ncbi:hypothetical protein LHYA1_G005388 [Lachnellula hyalina]|uniref:Cell wall mannoprotein n=1 Tax=Lachnellula hyalina TaxID=1316788 RepID=A0A8H8TYG0_9HELO|nr:uncharacterized protein LHYA1_G005388 [Lachnellula hyalina]TVY25345.1 hypothetical protein LHYA1_G005388 [Lachnellula hyalina]